MNRNKKTGVAADSSKPPEEKGKKLNLFNCFSLALGGQIGSGIFLMLGVAIAITGRSASLAVLIAVVVMTGANMFSYVMSSMFPLRGGVYSQQALILPPILVGLSGLSVIFVGLMLSMYGTGMADYFSDIFPAIVPYKLPFALLIITLAFLATIKGSKFIASIQSVMVIILLASIALFIAFGLPKVQPDYLTAPRFLSKGPAMLLVAAGLMTFTCTGGTGPIAMAAVTKKPTKTIPKSLLLSALALVFIYGLMAVIASGVLPVEQVMGQSLSVVAQAIFPTWAYYLFIVVGVFFAFLTSLLAGVAMLRYPLLQIARDGWLPSACKKTTKTGYPWVIQLGFYIVTIIPIIFNFSIQEIVSMVMVPSMLLQLYCNIAVIRLPKKYPKQWSKSIFRMPQPCFVILMCISVFCNLFIVYNSLKSLNELKSILMVVAVVAISFLYLIIRIKTNKVDCAKFAAKKLAIQDEIEQEDIGAAF